MGGACSAGIPKTRKKGGISEDEDGKPPIEGRSDSSRKRSSVSGNSGISGLGRAIGVFDALGSGVSNLSSSGFVSGFTIRGNKIGILAFEVANTLAKAASLMQFLSEENVRNLKQKAFYSEGVQRLVSNDTDVLFGIVATDKREELNALYREIVRFGNLCKDSQCHNLNHVFAKMHSENAAYGSLKEQAGLKMIELTISGYATAELYHELNVLDKFEEDYREKEAESLHLPCKESLMLLQTKLKHQRRRVTSLKRKSLWSKRMEEIVEKLVDIVAFIHQQIFEVFGNIDDGKVAREPFPERLGVAGLALHYANLINQIESIASSQPSVLPANTRDSLYNALPASIKSDLRSSLTTSDDREEFSVPQIKAEMDKILEWLVPMASNTASMYQGFGGVGDWANTSNDFQKKAAAAGNHIRFQTLYHADKQKIDFYILELVKLLHYMMSAVKQRDQDHQLISSVPVTTRGRIGLSVRSDVRRFPSLGSGNPIHVELSQEERSLLERVSHTQSLPILSKSREA